MRFQTEESIPLVVAGSSSVITVDADATHRRWSSRRVLALAITAASLAGAAIVAMGVTARKVGIVHGNEETLSLVAAQKYNLILSDEYSRSLGRHIGDGLYRSPYIAQVLKPTRLLLSDATTGKSVTYVTWAVDGREVKDVADVPSATSVDLIFTSTGEHAVEATTPSGATETFTVSVKVVRREIRDLTEADREAYFDAMHKMYTVGQEAGEEQYGATFTSSDYLVREHLYGAAQKSCDHWHDDAGFLTHHVGVTWQFEKSLRLVDPSTASHYWDYTREDSEGVNWWESNIFGEEWFGPCNPSDPDHIVNVGRWAYTPVMKDARSFSNITNPYGLLRSPWNTNPTPYLMRYARVLGSFGDKNREFPTCASFASVLSESMTLADILQELNGGLHGPVHLMTGGQWNTQIHDMVRYGSRENFPDSFLLMSKALWRQGLIRTPSYCSADTKGEDCMATCPESLTKGKTAEEIFETYGLYSITSNLPLVEGFSAEELLTELCHVGYPGEMFTSAAPQDPLFWPLHGNAERFVQLIRILQEYGQVELDETWGYEHSKNLASDTGIVCDWSQVTGMEMPTCKMETCPGHKENDILPFANLAEALPKYVSNIELYEAIHPYSSAMDYVYDSLDYWKGCTSHSLAYQALGTNILGT